MSRLDPLLFSIFYPTKTHLFYHHRRWSLNEIFQPNRIFIIGHTGALKWLTGEALAKKLGWQAIDANPGLERYIGRNLNEILGKQGEEAFHECESEIISHYTTKRHVVIILEEAVIASKKNRNLLSSEFVIYLKVNPESQLQKWQSGRTPLLPITDLKSFLNKQHIERDSLYEVVATLSIDSNSVDENVNTIMKEISE